MFRRRKNLWLIHRHIRLHARHTRLRFQKWRSLGAWGERQAKAYLEKQGLWIRNQNWHCPIGELDIVAQDRGVLIFVEVKTRQLEVAKAFSPEEAVDYRKVEKLKALSKWYIQHERVDIRRKRLQKVRFDTIGIIASKSCVGWKTESVHWIQNDCLDKLTKHNVRRDSLLFRTDNPYWLT